MSNRMLNGVGLMKSGDAPENNTVREEAVVCSQSLAYLTNTKWSAVRGIIGSPQTKGYKPIADVAPSLRRLRAGVIPRTRNYSEYAIEWPARAELDEILMSVVKPEPLGGGHLVTGALAGIHRLLHWLKPFVWVGARTHDAKKQNGRVDFDYGSGPSAKESLFGLVGGLEKPTARLCSREPENVPAPYPT